MRIAEVVNLTYFAFFTILGVMWALPSHSRIKAILIGLAGFGINLTASAAPGVVRDWLPVPLMALAYWQSGCFFQRPNPRLQSLFESWERKILEALHIHPDQLARSWLGGLFELAYMFCYPVVPLGLGVLYISGISDAADEYWTIVLLSAYPCYILLPFIQLLPPRLVERTDVTANRTAHLRGLNLWLVRRITHQANTFPSGHVAASTAIALVLLRLTPVVGIVFAFIAAGIAAGCTVGRYHYIVDVVAALGLAATIFAIVAL